VNLGKPELRRCDQMQRAKDNRRKNETLREQTAPYALSRRLSNELFLGVGT
jgi:hypothetical protein